MWDSYIVTSVCISIQGRFEKIEQDVIENVKLRVNNWAYVFWDIAFSLELTKLNGYTFHAWYSLPFTILSNALLIKRSNDD